MPMPVVAKQCNGLLFPPDQRMISNDLTTRLYVSPPTVASECEEIFEITVYDKDNNANGHQEIITAIKPSTIDLTEKSEMGSSTDSGQMPMYRLGSIHIKPDHLTAYGHFVYYVPSVVEWVTGKTQFYTSAKDCHIEFYTDSNGIDPDLIKVDENILSTHNYKFNDMNYFKRQYGHFIMSMPHGAKK
uniref:Velvet domain-containing protein n=1 Tax=Rhabditophanes sp. KR3021 TaxID=114890 RepID=A0AC35TXX7_9BILA